MKLTRENIYINLQGKSKEELTELYWVLKNNNQKLSRQKLDDFLGYKNHSSYYVLIYDDFGWSGDDRFDKQEVTIQQLKEILQPMENKEFDLSMCRILVDNEEQAKQLQEYAFKQDFTWYLYSKEIQYLHRKVFYFDSDYKTISYSDLEYNEDRFKTFHFKDIFKTEPNLTEQLEKAEAEVKRLKEAIEEESKPKSGDICIIDNGDYKFIKTFYDDEYFIHRLKIKKITDKELINKLNELIK